MAKKTKNYQFNSEPSYRSFIFTTIINYLKNYFKSIEREMGQLLQIHYDESGIPSTGEENHHVGEAVEEQESVAITLLKVELDKREDWQRILLLMRCQEIPYSEISKIVNKPVEQLKKGIVKRSIILKKSKFTII